MNELSVHSYRVPEQQRQIGEEEEHNNRRTGCREECTTNEADQTSVDPQ
jgi:hypothetical protein